MSNVKEKTEVTGRASEILVRFTLPLLLAVFLAGCIDVDQEITINKDGSGEYKVTYTVREETVNQMKALFNLRDQLAEAQGLQDPPSPDNDRLVRLFFEPSEDLIKEELARHQQHGIAVKRLTVDSSKGMRKVKMLLTFDDIASVAKADFFPQYGFSLQKNAAGNYVFYRPPETDQRGEMPDVSDPETLKVLVPIFGGFRVVSRVRVPGKIIDSNAHTAARFAANWVYDFDADNNAVTMYQTDSARIVFDGAGLDLPQFKVPSPQAEPSP